MAAAGRHSESDYPNRPGDVSQRRDRPYTERFTFENGDGDTVYGYLLLPKDIDTPAPAVLYHHEHGGKYPLGKDAALEVRENGYAPGLALVEAGLIVMAIDAYGFGERERLGPAGEAESGAETELSLFKHFLWQGKTLWGMMIHDDLSALAYLRSRPEVDESRIGATGMSLGGSRSTWLAALDETIKAVAPISQMTRYRDFADNGTLPLARHLLLCAGRLGEWHRYGAYRLVDRATLSVDFIRRQRSAFPDRRNPKRSLTMPGTLIRGRTRRTNLRSSSTKASPTPICRRWSNPCEQPSSNTSSPGRQIISVSDPVSGHAAGRHLRSQTRPLRIRALLICVSLAIDSARFYV